MDQIDNFDLQAYLEDRDIPFWTEGKNVAAGWIGIQCPFCDDQSNHLGINIEGKNFTCWLCDEKGGLIKLLREMEDRPNKRKIKEILEEFQDNSYMPVSPEEAIKINTEVLLPKEIVNYWPKLHLRYLQSRQHDPDLLIKDYSLMPTHTAGDYSWSIIVPFFLKSTLVTFIVMSIADQIENRYRAASKSESIITTRDTLYNYDSVEPGEVMFITEGLFDTWRLDQAFSGAVGLMGKKVTEEQFSLIVRKEPSKVVIVLDSDATKEIEDLGNRLAAHKLNPVGIKMLKGDADTLNANEINYIRKILNLG